MSISDTDRSPDLDYVATVHHGVDTGGLPFTASGGPGLVRDVDQAVAAVAAARAIDRAGCRARACARFDADRMVADYLTVYEQVIGKRRD
ncbi:hypothetical protein [Paractinoplanes durhamensis]|uniref:Glycosyltransferase n=1 Tax=Paractinoplanes durhamensis TaxID=113563 RepID=A0ABQ3Z6X3_9ACTN|nr:hypothetical protein [Actinoplanes durhamensis]GIE05580.1 hypothetical protein Adu01nite_69300 [Actinoplanes durhamensis]